MKMKEIGPGACVLAPPSPGSANACGIIVLKGKITSIVFFRTLIFSTVCRHGYLFAWPDSDADTNPGRDIHPRYGYSSD